MELSNLMFSSCLAAFLFATIVAENPEARPEVSGQSGEILSKWISKCGKFQIDCDLRIHYCDDKANECSPCTTCDTDPDYDDLCRKICAIYMWEKEKSSQSTTDTAIATIAGPAGGPTANQATQSCFQQPMIMIVILALVGVLALMAIALVILVRYVTKRREYETKDDIEKPHKETVNGKVLIQQSRENLHKLPNGDKMGNATDGLDQRQAMGGSSNRPLADPEETKPLMGPEQANSQQRSLNTQNESH